MNIVKPILFFLLLVSFHQAFSQTKLIAHKSHGGKRSTLDLLSTEDNFGLPSRSESIKRVTKLDSRTVVIEYHYYGAETVKDHEVFCNPLISLDSLKSRYDEHVEFIGFDKPYTNPEDKKKNKKDFFIGLFWWNTPAAGLLILITTLCSLIGGLAYYHWKSTLGKLHSAPLFNHQ